MQDANNLTIALLPRPFSKDASGKVSLDKYVIDFNEQSRMLELKVKVDNVWLISAKYPVVVDPLYTTTLTNVTGVYDGHVYNTNKRLTDLTLFESCINIMIGSSEACGYLAKEERAQRGFITFNTSSLSEDILINKVEFNFSIIVTAQFNGQNVSISRFNGSEIDNSTNYPQTSDGNTALWNNISTGYNGAGFYIINSTEFNQTKNLTINLGSNASKDLQDQLPEDYFSLGFQGTFETTGPGIEKNARIISSEYVEGMYLTPKLIVTYQVRRNATVWPELMGRVGSGVFSLQVTGGVVDVGVTHIFNDHPIRGHITFPLTNVSINSTILNATLFYYITSTDYSINEGVEFRKIDEIVNLNSSPLHIFYNITRTGLGRSYGLANGTDVSTTGWKNISLNSNFVTDLQNNLNQINGSISIGLNGSNETIDYGKHEVLIDYTNSQKPYLIIEYYEGNGSAVTYNAGIDGIVNSDGTATTSSSTLTIGKPVDDPGSMPIEVGFMSFITSSINDSSSIQRVFLRINITIYPMITIHDYNISRLNDSCIDSNSVDTTARGQEVYNNVTKNIVYKRVSSPRVGFIDIDLGSNATIDLQGKLSSNCFSLGLYDNTPVQGEQISISSMEGNFPPELHVVFEGSFNDNVDCIAPPFGDWSCNQTCTFINQEVVAPENLHVRDACLMTFAGSSNLTFSHVNSSIFTYRLGEVRINDTAGFNKK